MFNTAKYLKETQPKIEIIKSELPWQDTWTYQHNRERLVLPNGESISIQASHTHYCEPREDGDQPYVSVELGFPSFYDEELLPYAETPEDFHGTVFGNVPLEVVDRVINRQLNLGKKCSHCGVTRKKDDYCHRCGAAL
jgi:hypothetical protein